MVALATLLWSSRVEGLCDSDPVEGTVSLYERHEVGIFGV